MGLKWSQESTLDDTWFQKGGRGPQTLVIGYKRCSENWRAAIKKTSQDPGYGSKKPQIWLKMIPRSYSWCHGP